MVICTNIIFANNYCNSVVYFLNPDCKLCISKSFDINNTLKNCNYNNIKVHFIFHDYIDKKKIKKFTDIFDKKLAFESIYDESNVIAEKFNVNITPTVILFNESCEVIYKGAIDDKDISIQKSKLSYAINYIDEAIKSYLNKEKIDVSCTTPVGCIFR
jgi:hypothetical protein